MHIERQDLRRAARGLVTPEKADALWDALAERCSGAAPAPARLGALRSLGACLLGAAAVVALAPLVSALAGLVALAAGVAVDGRTRRDHAAALYLAGLTAFWGGMSTHGAQPGTGFALLGAFVNASLVVVALVLGRRTFAAFGAVGLAGVAGRLASANFLDEVLPLAFAAIGVAAAAAAALYPRLEAVAARAVVTWLPEGLRALLPPARRSPPGR